MVKTAAMVFAADVTIIAALFLVAQDLAWRAAYAASLHSACVSPCGYSPSYSLGVLTRFLTMTSGGVTLTSPPMLDWVQLLGLLLVVVNGWYAFNLLRSRRTAHRGAPGPSDASDGK